jgi:hypothetical protein
LDEEVLHYISQKSGNKYANFLEKNVEDSRDDIWKGFLENGGN